MSPSVSTRSSITLSMFRSVKLFTELPACSKKDQKSIEKNIRISTTNRRSRSTFGARIASKTSTPKASTPKTTNTQPAMVLRWTSRAMTGMARSTPP